MIDLLLSPDARAEELIFAATLARLMLDEREEISLRGPAAAEVASLAGVSDPAPGSGLPVQVGGRLGDSPADHLLTFDQVGTAAMRLVTGGQQQRLLPFGVAPAILRRFQRRPPARRLIVAELGMPGSERERLLLDILAIASRSSRVAAVVVTAPSAVAGQEGDRWHSVVRPSPLEILALCSGATCLVDPVAKIQVPPPSSFLAQALGAPLISAADGALGQRRGARVISPSGASAEDWASAILEGEIPREVEPPPFDGQVLVSLFRRALEL